jgi:FHA domain-containing protein/TIR domain-containing protein
MVLTLALVGDKTTHAGIERRKIFRAEGGSIGRAADNDWVLTDPHVSGRHARLRYVNGRFFIVDTSTNGTFINSPTNRLDRGNEYELKPGDRLFIEPYEIEVSIAPEAADDPFDRPPVLERTGMVLRHDTSGVPVPGDYSALADDSLDPLEALGLDAPASVPAAPPRAPLAEHSTPPPARSISPIPAPGSLIPENWDDSSSDIVLKPFRIATPKEQPPVRDAHFAAFAPTCVVGGKDFILDIWAYAAGFEQQAFELARRGGAASLRGSKGAIAIEIGTTLTIWIDVPGFASGSTTESVVWNGSLVNATFVLRPEPGVADGTHVGTARIMSGSVPLALLHFELNVGATPDAVAKVGAAERTIRSVFASYASENRFDVLQWARGAELVGVDVFIDVLKFREAADWATELLHQVPTRDAFCLFWSEPARRSTWVEREWRCALSTRGVDYIHPVPLVDPRILPPPMELEGKHFGGTTFLIQMYEQRLKADRAQT